MKREFHAEQLDVHAFAHAAAELSGAGPLLGWRRLASEAQGSDGAELVHWHVRGELRPDRSGVPQAWLHLQAHTVLPLTCQRCLAPVPIALDVENSFRFVADENTAAEEDDEAQEDVLVLSRRFNLPELIEDELLLAMPLVPLHETCPVEVKLAVTDAAFEQAQEERPQAFAALGRLKAPKKKS